MDYNTPENLATCATIVKEASSLLYYSHIPTSAIVLLIGLFVLIESKKNLAGKLLFLIAIIFSLWSFIDLSVWFNYDKNTILMFAWSFFGILYLSIYALSVYFVYVFIDKKDISFFKKIILGLIMLPVIIFTPTTYNLEKVDIVNCIAIEGNYFTNYYYFAGLALFFWILFVVITRYKHAVKNAKKQILFLGLGLELFLFSFFSIGFLVSYLVDNGYIANGNYIFEQYGLFGMPIFMAFLAYLIVKFKAFDIKLIATQALVVAIIILIGSQFAFIKTLTNQILTGITLALACVGGYVLIKSVKLEIEKSAELEIANKEIHTRNIKLNSANKEISRRKEELQLMSDRLAESNDKLRQLDNAKTEFISMASHQLRTPVTGIKGYVDMLIEGSYGPLTPDQLDAIKKTYNCNERMITLIEDLLNASKIESGRMEYEFANCHIEDICQEVVDTLINKAQDKNLYLDYKKPSTPLPELYIDGNKVREVISNLVDNAIKYTEKGGATLKVEKINKVNKKEKDKIRITVSDTGIGIPKEEMPYLFTKFSRGKNVKRLNVSGTGLGLYVGKNIIEGNGGKIWVESPGAGQGSKFVVEMEVGTGGKGLVK